jgi:hypothetical protein
MKTFSTKVLSVAFYTDSPRQRIFHFPDNPYVEVRQEGSFTAYITFVTAVWAAVLVLSRFPLHPEHIGDSAYERTWPCRVFWWQPFVLRVECGMMFRKREKKILAALPLQNVLRRTANESQKNRKEKDKTNISLLHCKSKILVLCNVEYLIQHILASPIRYLKSGLSTILV